MFNDNQQYAADDGDGEEREQTAVVEDGQTEALLVDALVKTFLLVKVDVDQILQVPRLVVVLDLLGNWFLNIKKSRCYITMQMQTHLTSYQLETSPLLMYNLDRHCLYL